MVQSDGASGLTVGTSAEQAFVVGDSDTAAALGSGLVAGLSTPRMLAWMEQVACAAVHPHLEAGRTTVGTAVVLKHLAATPVGARVRIRAELLSAEGRKLRFSIEARDPFEVIGQAEHERFIVDEARFAQRLEAKSRSLPGSAAS